MTTRLPLDYRPEDDADLLLACQDRRWRILSGQLYKIMTKGTEDRPGGVVPFVPNDAQKAFLKRLHHRNVILKARQLGFCLDPATPVLALDDRNTPVWRRIDDLEPGDAILAPDEAPKADGRRSIRPTFVIASQTRTAPRVRIDFDDGSSLIATDEHPILAAPQGSDGRAGLAWRTASGRGNGSHAEAGGGGGLAAGAHVARISIPPAPSTALNSGGDFPYPDFASVFETDRPARVVGISQIGPGPVVDLQTEAGTYVADGFMSHNTTLISILWLDHALFTSHQRCGIVAHNLEDAQVIFRDKVRFAYENLPLVVQKMFPPAKESADELLFERTNSSIRVATSMRSGTIHRLHVSEMGKIAAHHPQKANEIVTGSFPAVPESGVAVVESTAEGQQGEFYDLAQRAEKRALVDRPLGRHEWRFHFFPWWVTPEYKANPREVSLTAEDHSYFDDVEAKTGSQIRLPQRAWYVAKREFEMGGDLEKMWREYPSTSDECWQQSTEGTYFARQVMRARVEGRVGAVPPVSHAPVFTFWDIGAGDGTGIWLMQHVGVQHRFIRYIEGWSEGYEYYVRQLRETGFLFGVMYLPHDATQTRQVADTVASPLDMLSEIAPDWDWRVVPRVQEKQHAIELARAKFSECWFDEEGCREGIRHLELYRKKWNARMGAWSEEPEKLDGHSEAADAFMQFATGFNPGDLRRPKGRRPVDGFDLRARRGGGRGSMRPGMVI